MRRGLSRAVLMAVAVVSSLAAPAARAADGWSDVGASGRPSWVPESVERRLRLLAALPAIHNTVQAQADTYFLGEGPGLAVGLALDDGLYYSGGFGFADAARTRRPDENTVFRAGSLSKVITGTALLTLIDDQTRNMSLDDDADKYLPELKFVCPTFNQPCARGSQSLGIKLMHLVSHTSGLPNVMGDAHPATWLADFKKSWLLFAPGSFSAYSGVAVEGVGLIEERISGKDYVQFVHDALFAPLHMNRSTMDEETLPSSTRAQKWQFTAASNICKQKCNKDETTCMSTAHSGPERKLCIAEKIQCVKDCPPVKPAWSFSKVDYQLPGDAQTMFRPAGSLATTVKDLGSFMTMWLSGVVPQVDGRPLLGPWTIASAATSMFASKVSPPASCKNGRTDSNNFAYSPCGTAYGFRVNWFVGNVPFIEHSGGIGISGSQTRVDKTRKMGATGLVSTEPSPTLTPQPAGLDKNFMNTVVYGLLNAGLVADTATGWSGLTLADGVARVLYLSGKAPAQGDIQAFTADFVAQNHLTEGNVVAFLDDWHDRVGLCRGFRVRDVVNAGRIETVFNCDKGPWDAVLAVSGQPPHRISWTEVPSPPSPPSQQCLQACSAAERHCMEAAHSGPERGLCVKERMLCNAECD